MRKLFIVSAILLASVLSYPVLVNAQWKPAGEKMKTPWAEKVDPTNVLSEYPRPLMVRSQWSNLNGLWDFAITPQNMPEPTTFGEQILVPFAVESSLSGVQKTVTPKDQLWYKRKFDVPSSWKGKDVLLHFGAVDWRTDVFVNGAFVGSHQGGFTPFSFNISPFLTAKGNQTLSVRVWDPTDTGYQARGKQVLDAKGIWYTAVSGIWQTVWIEPVVQNYISNVKSIPDLDNGKIAVTVCAPNAKKEDMVEVTLLDGGRVVATAKGLAGATLPVYVSDPKLWSPDSPFLYDMRVVLLSGGKKADEVTSYTAMRKISHQRDPNGFNRMYLNNEPLFHFGPLDQGWWPDGLYTAPTDEALLFDIIKTKELGYNMIRKHVKVESARWYYHCDREGVLVWQDMPSGDGGNHWAPEVYGGGSDKNRTTESKEAYYAEWKAIMDFCMSNPSVVMWVPFNEGWGQFDTEIVSEWTKSYDPSRIVNSASGGNFRACGDVIDSHTYPAPRFKMFDPLRVNILGEYGGIGLPIQGHLWRDQRNWGYIQFKNTDEVTDEYVKYTEQLIDHIKCGFSAAVYTQTTDVEGEVNGLITYDRKLMKIDVSRIKAANEKVIKSMTK